MQPVDYFSAATGIDKITPDAAQPKAKEGWGEWAVNSVRGRQDPKEAATGTVYEQFTPELKSPTASAAMMGADDAAMADIIQKNLGDKFVRREQDVNGNPVMVTRGKNGQEQRGYVNKPGLDSQDIWRGFYGLAPYAVTGGLAGSALKGSGLAANAIGQGITGAGTKLAGNVGQIVQGSEQGIDPVGAVVVGGFSAAGPVAGAASGALWRKFVTIPGLIDRSTGQLTAKGLEAAQKAGINPEDITPDFAKSFAENLAKTQNPAQAAVRADTDQYGIRVTRGQATKDKEFLHQEEAARWGTYGEAAKKSQTAFDDAQRRELLDAAMGGNNGVGRMLAPHRATERGNTLGSNPGPLGEDIQGSLKAARDTAGDQEGEIWKGVRDLTATPEALQDLPPMLNSKLGGLMPNERVTPAAAAMSQEIERMMSGKAPEKAAAWLESVPTHNVDQMRRSLLALYKGAQNDTDRMMSKNIYDGFNDWISSMAEKKLLAGDPESALALIKARGFTREVRDIFEPKTDAGKASTAAGRIGKILDPAVADSGESVIKTLFGSSGSRTINDGGVLTLQKIKMAFDRFLPAEQAKPAWDDIRLSYWSRLVTGKGGETLNPLQLSSNLKQAMGQQRSIMNELFSHQEMRDIARFSRAVGAIAYKPPNASGSSYGVANFAREAVKALTSSLMQNKLAGTVINAAINKTGVADAYGATVARNALSQSVKPQRPNLSPLSAGVGNALYNAQSGR